MIYPNIDALFAGKQIPLPAAKHSSTFSNNFFQFFHRYFNSSFYVPFGKPAFSGL